jgi:zinc protease
MTERDSATLNTVDRTVVPTPDQTSVRRSAADRERLHVDRSRLPGAGPARPFRFPAIDKSSLPNGLRVWTVRHPSVPVITVMLLLKRGSADDPIGRSGLASMTLDMLDEGTGGRSAIEVHEVLGRLGARLDSDIGSDAMLLGITALSRFTGPALMLLADLAARPTLADDDFQRVRQLRLHRLKQLRDVPGAVADRAYMRLLYGDHPYGHTSLGNERALTEMTVEDVRAFHQAALRPADATLVVVGDCEHHLIVDHVATAFAGWDGRPADESAAQPTVAQPPRLNIVPRAGASQSELRIGHVAVPRNTPDYHALVTANAVLGGQFVSRINQNLREEKGFTYGAYTAFEFRRQPGPFTLHCSVQTQVTARAIEESLAEISAIRGPRPATSDELALGIAGLTRGYARNFETAEQIARAVAQLALYDLPDDYFAEFVPRVERVTVDDVTTVTARHLDPARLTTLVVGDLDEIGGELAHLGLGDPVVLAADEIW